MELRGTLDHIPVLDEILKQEGVRALLVGGVGRAFHENHRNPRRAGALLPRKDTDLLLLDEGVELPKLEGVDLLRRFTYTGDWNLLSESGAHGEVGFPYWRNPHAFLDVSFPNIDSLELDPGLHIPDELFLVRMLSRWQMGSTFDRRRFPDELLNQDELFDFELFKVKARRFIDGDAQDVLPMDKICVRPLTRFEKYCLMSAHDSRYGEWKD